MKNLRLLTLLTLGLLVGVFRITMAQAEPVPENKLLAGAYNPLSTLEVSTTTEVSNMLILLKHGRIEIHDAVFCKLDIPFNSTRSSHGMLVGDMTLTLDSLAPDSETQFNLFDAMNPGEDVVLHPKELYFHVGQRSGFHVESVGYIQSYREWGELPDDLQGQFYKLYMESYGEGWWDSSPDLLEQYIDDEFITIANPKFGKLGTPKEQDWFIRFNNESGQLWEIDTEWDELNISRKNFHTFNYFGSPPRKKFFLQDREHKLRVTKFEQFIEVTKKKPTLLSWNKYVQTETNTYDLNVMETQVYLDLDYALFRENISVTDAHGALLAWEEVDDPATLSTIRVFGPFEPEVDYQISISSQIMSLMLLIGEDDLHEFTFRPNQFGYKYNKPFTIHVKMPEGMDYKFMAASGALTSYEDGVFTASWPAQALSHGVIAHTMAEGRYQSDNYLIKYIVPEDLLGTPEVENSVAGFALWLDLKAKLFGKLPVDEWIAIFDPERDFDSVKNPVNTKLKLSSSLFNTEYQSTRLWQFQTQIYDLGLSWYFREPEYWHDAVNDYTYFSALREFADQIEGQTAEEKRESELYLHFRRHFPGTANELLAWRMDRTLGYRITAALLAIDFEAPDLLRESIIKPLFLRGLEQGNLTFEEISETFLALENTPARHWWQTLVLDGELPSNAFTKENHSLPGITPVRLEKQSIRKLQSKASSNQLFKNPFGARYFYQEVVDEELLPKRTYLKAENHYIFGEYQHALDLLDIADSSYGYPGGAVDRYVLRPLCLIELGRNEEALVAIEYGLVALEGSDDYTNALLEIKAQLTVP